MQFQVPQFIEIEDKIIGPLTFKQFLFIIGGAGGAFIFYQLPIWGTVKFFMIILCFGVGMAFAFLKVGHKTLLSTLEDATLFYTSTHLYLWKKVIKPVSKKEKEFDTSLNSGVLIPTLSQSKLKDLTWGLDVQARKKDM